MEATPGVHRLWQVIDDVDRSHKGLGMLAAIQLVAAKAHLVLLPVAPAGCGKSVIGRAIAEAVGKRMQFDSLTRSGLAKLQEQFTNYRGVVIVDDLGKVENDYSRISTMTTLVELAYSHYVSKHSAQMHIDIHDFYGTAIINCQPVVLRSIVRSPEWDATIADKSLRFYHWWRPTEENYDEVVLPTLPEAEIEDVASVDRSLPGYGELEAIGKVQWSRGRLHLHISGLLKSAALIDGRFTVDESDIAVLTHIMRPMNAERYAMRKDGFEDGRDLDSNLLCFFVEWATHGAFTVQNLCEDYHIPPATAYRILNAHRLYWTVVDSHPTRYAPNPEFHGADGLQNMVDVLHTCGIAWPHPKQSTAESGPIPAIEKS